MWKNFIPSAVVSYGVYEITPCKTLIDFDVWLTRKTGSWHGRRHFEINTHAPGRDAYAYKWFTSKLKTIDSEIFFPYVLRKGSDDV